MQMQFSMKKKEKKKAARWDLWYEYFQEKWSRFHMTQMFKFS